MKYTIDKVEIDSLEQLEQVAPQAYHVVVVIDDMSATEAMSAVFKAAREHGRYVSPGCSYIHGVSTYHLFPLND
jgi:chemotaxis protein CheY-P-specific phosphatase CheC